MKKTRPFPAPVRWLAVWRHRWVILNFLNQVAHGDYEDATRVVRHYGGSSMFGREFYDAARDCIDVPSHMRVDNEEDCYSVKDTNHER